MVSEPIRPATWGLLWLSLTRLWFDYTVVDQADCVRGGNDG
jgi:hypothetical protein